MLGVIEDVIFLHIHQCPENHLLFYTQHYVILYQVYNFFDDYVSLTLISLLFNIVFNDKLNFTETVRGIQEAENRIVGKILSNHENVDEDKTKIKAAIFYSISSTQTGLQVQKNIN